MKNFNKNNGITLIALVVTIIILLILAGITISQLTENGIFKKVKEAKEKFRDAQQKEENILKDYDNEMELATSRYSETAEKMMKPTTWSVGVQQDFGDGIYGQRFVGNKQENVTYINTSFNTTTYRIIGYGGYVTYSDGSIAGIPAANPENSSNTNCYIVITSGGLLLESGGWPRGNYDVWVLYTITTPTTTPTE